MSQPTPGDPDALKAEVDLSREQLAATVDELTARLAVGSQAKERALRTRDTVVETYRESPPVAAGGAAVLLGLVVTVVLWRRRRRSRRSKR
jgi:hypothetical protein